MATKDREPVQLWSNQLPTISQGTTTDFFAKQTVGQSDRLKTLKYRTLWNFGVGTDRTDDIRELWYATELSKSLSCLSDNRSGRCGQCVRPIKHLPDLHFFYNFNWITHILAKSIKWFVYSFKWYLGILKVSTTHFCVTCGNIHTIQ